MSAELTVGIQIACLLAYVVVMIRLLRQEAGPAMGMLQGIALCLPMLKQNSLVGIRTPKLMADAEAWRAAHEMGGLTLSITVLVIALGMLYIKGKARALALAGGGLLWGVGIMPSYGF